MPGRCMDDFLREPIDINGEEIRECPGEYVGSDSRAIDDLFTAATYAKQGLWPITGGWLNQTAVCVDGVHYVWAVLDSLRLKTAGEDEK